MIVQIFFVIVFYPIFALIYYEMKQMGNFKNGNYFACVMKSEWMKDETVQEIGRTYAKQIKWSALVMAVIPITTFFIPYFSVSFSIWMIWLIAMLVVPSCFYGRANEQVKGYKAKRGFQMEAGKDEEDTYWKWGMFYYNPKDKHTMVSKRNGTGITTNMATTTGKILNGIGIAGLLVIPVLCGWMILEEFVPIHLTVTKEELVAKHLVKDYEIPLEDIESIELIYEKPRWTKSVGTAMENLDKGTFTIRNEGKCEVFLNPNHAVFIRLTADDKTYYLGGYDNEETVRAYEHVLRMSQSH